MTFLSIIRYRLEQGRQQLGFVPPLTQQDEAEVAGILPSAALALFHTMSIADQQHSLRVYRGLKERGCTEVEMLMAALLHDVGKAQGRVPFWTRPAIVLGKQFAPRLLARLVVHPNTFAPYNTNAVGTDDADKQMNMGRNGVGASLSAPATGEVRSNSLSGMRAVNVSAASRQLDWLLLRNSPDGCAQAGPYEIRRGEGVKRIGCVPKWRRALSYAWWHADVGAELAAQAGLPERSVLYIRTHHQPQGPARELHLVDEIS